MAAKSEYIRQLLKTVPQSPGVYQYFDKNGTIIYVGKAKNLKNRVSSYFNKNKHESGRTHLLVKKIDDIRYIVVNTEQDALLLENSLIKKYQPKYNVMLKDDKSYPWICIKNERFPRIFSTRRMIKDGSEYFGPFTSVKVVRSLLDLAKQLYALRTCNYNLSEENIEAGKFRICLEYHIGNCKGPCEGRQSEEDYMDAIQSIKEIIKGNTHGVLQHLKRLMTEAAENLEFEQAQLFKERLERLKTYQSKSTVVNPSINNVDVYSVTSDQSAGYVNFMRVVNGAIIQSYTTELKKKLEETDEELLEVAIMGLRERFPSTAKEVLVSHEMDMELEGVHIKIPQRGDKKHLLELSSRNAHYYMLDKHKQEKLVDPERHTKRILATMKDDLRLKELPRHIECFDNSNFQGSFPVSACVVFKNTKPAKKEYRHFNIKTVVGPDDFASMEEAVHRRYRRLLEEDESLPNLIVIDGGKGQLSAAVKALDRLGLYGKIPVIGIAKRLEEIYFPGDSIPIYIDKRSETLKVIQHLRNEAHRFGITHHRHKRSKAALGTELVSIPNIGPKTATKLLKKYKSVAEVRKAKNEELEAFIGKAATKSLREYFQD